MKMTRDEKKAGFTQETHGLLESMMHVISLSESYDAITMCAQEDIGVLHDHQISQVPHSHAHHSR